MNFMKIKILFGNILYHISKKTTICERKHFLQHKVEVSFEYVVKLDSVFVYTVA